MLRERAGYLWRKKGSTTVGAANSLKEWMDSGTVVPGFLCTVSPRSISSRVSAEDTTQSQFKHDLAFRNRKPVSLYCTHPLTPRCTSPSWCGNACCLWCLLRVKQERCAWVLSFSLDIKITMFYFSSVTQEAAALFWPLKMQKIEAFL